MVKAQFLILDKIMPGHEKKGGGGADPDPSPYLIVSYEEKQQDLAKVIIDLSNFNFLVHFCTIFQS